ncbi:MAG TPA: helix-turn-helix domain-containing protein, partial [Mycobacteriales bacterium]|nr:helix-turn-helix domain-containing protein [Mycobacteriales bacterium]
MTQVSSVGVLDKAVTILECLAGRPASLAELVERTGLSRPTAYRLAVALEVHRLAER